MIPNFHLNRNVVYACRSRHNVPGKLLLHVGSWRRPIPRGLHCAGCGVHRSTLRHRAAVRPEPLAAPDVTVQKTQTGWLRLSVPPSISNTEEMVTYHSLMEEMQAELRLESQRANLCPVYSERLQGSVSLAFNATQQHRYLIERFFPVIF